MGQDLMQQSKISASLQLMQDLLTCPAGEEWILLKRHEALVDAEFVQLMEQVAAQLQREGDCPAATFLRNWAAQLHHVLLKDVMPHASGFQPAPAHLELIQQLAQQPEQIDELLAQSGELIRPELVQVIHDMAQQLLAQGDRKTAQLLEQIAARVNQAWIQSHTASPQPSEPDAASPPGAAAATKSAAAPASVKPLGDGDGEQIEPADPASPQPIPDPWQRDTPVSSALQLKVPQQIANGLHEVTLLLHELNKAIATQTTALQALAQTIGPGPASTMPQNPLWYMDVLERAQELDWLLSTEEVAQLLGVKPQCHGHDRTYVRGCWEFEKVGKLGTQTAWHVHKRRTP